MKDIKLTQNFTIIDMLERIKSQAKYGGDYKEDRDDMVNYIDYFISLIREGKIKEVKK